MEEVPVVPDLGLGGLQSLEPVVACHWQLQLAELPHAVALGVLHPCGQIQGLGQVGQPCLVAGQNCT